METILDSVSGFRPPGRSGKSSVERLAEAALETLAMRGPLEGCPHARFMEVAVHAIRS